MQAPHHKGLRESGGRLRLLTGSGPEGSSPGELRRVARLLLFSQSVLNLRHDKRVLNA